MTSPTVHDPEPMSAKAGEAARLLGALANARRLLILCELAGGERSVSQLLPVAGLQQAALSQHLARLRAAGLVSTRRAAQMVIYRLSSPAAVAVINTLADIFCKPKPKRTQRSSARRNGTAR